MSGPGSEGPGSDRIVGGGPAEQALVHVGTINKNRTSIQLLTSSLIFGYVAAPFTKQFPLCLKTRVKHQN